MKNHIEERRKARGMTQQQLASELGVSRQTIISLENGKYNPVYPTGAQHRAALWRADRGHFHF